MRPLFRVRLSRALSEDKMQRVFHPTSLFVLACGMLPGMAAVPASALPVGTQTAPAAQSATQTSARASATGTVQAVADGSITLMQDKGGPVTVSLAPGVRVSQLAPGSKDLKSAQPATPADIQPGDRVLAMGPAGTDTSTLTANRIILMKSSAIAEREADWQRRGAGGIVVSSNAASGQIEIRSGGRAITLHTSPATVVRRYAAGSVSAQTARPTSLDQIVPGDQLRVRGDHSPDGTSIAAEEILFGSFENLAGTITAVDPAAGTLSLKEVRSGRTVTLHLGEDSNLRQLPPEMASRLAMRAAAAAGGAGAGAPGAGAGESPAGHATAPEATGARAHAFSGGGGLSSMISRLPKITATDLKPGEAVMVVASGTAEHADDLKAITLLTGVEPLMSAAAASHGGGGSMMISPFNAAGTGGDDSGSGADAGSGSGPGSATGHK